MSNERPRRYSSWGERVAGAALDAQKEMQDALFEEGLKAAPRAARIVVKTAGGAPGVVYNLGKLAGAKDKWREGFGIAGAVLGGTAGGALGAAAGGVNAPIGTIVGSSWRGRRQGHLRPAPSLHPKEHRPPGERGDP